jgi:hypothetical protein
MSAVKKVPILTELIGAESSSSSVLSEDSVSRISEDKIMTNVGKYSGIYNMNDFLKL